MTKFFVGTAGWSYLKWNRDFYPEGTSQEDQLTSYAERFNAVELNNSFYRTPSAEQLLSWENKVSARFVFALKASRYITHVKRLKDPRTTLPRFLDAVSDRHKKGPILFQLPPRFPLDLDRLEQFLAQLPRSERWVIELRDTAWHNEAVFASLKKSKVAFCLYDTPESISPRRMTADFAYVRLRGRKAAGLDRFLKEWREWLSSETDRAYVFFDNLDNKSLAFGNALKFRDFVGINKKSVKPKTQRK